jgi:hypothetical protein
MPITVQPAACWRLVDVDGANYPNDEDFGPYHYESKSAAEAVRFYTDDPPLTAVPFAAPCVVVTCDGCKKAVEDYDSGSTVHFASVKEAKDLADSAYEFSIIDDTAWCEDCAHLPHEPIVGPHGGVCDRCGEFDDAHEPVEAGAR